jgi:hypothetical protein
MKIFPCLRTKFYRKKTFYILSDMYGKHKKMPESFTEKKRIYFLSGVYRKHTKICLQWLFWSAKICFFTQVIKLCVEI